MSCPYLYCCDRLLAFYWCCCLINLKMSWDSYYSTVPWPCCQHHGNTLTWSSTAGNPWECLALVRLCNSLQGCRLPSDPVTMHRCPAPVQASAWSCFSQKQLIILLLFSVLFFFGCEACGILVPQLGIEPAPPLLEGEVLTNGLPGKSLQ